MCCHIHLKHMHAEAAHARCRSFSLLICTTSFLYACSTQVCLGWLVHARRLADTEPVASVTHWLPCKTVCLCHLPGDGSGVVHGWSGSGTGMERYGTGSGTKRPTPAQHCHCSASLSNSEISGGSNAASNS